MPRISWNRFRLLALLIALPAFIARAQNSTDAKLFPSPGAKDICIDTTLRLTFAQPMTLGGSGKVQIVDAASGIAVDTIDLAAAPQAMTGPAARGLRGAGPATALGVSKMPATQAAPTRLKSIGGLNNYNYYPIIVTRNQAEIFPAPGALAVGKSYYVKIDPGVFKSEASAYNGIDNPSTWKFSIKASVPDRDAAKLIVAWDSSGDFATIQGALDAIPVTKQTPTTVFVRKGTYTEMVYASDKHAVTILGEDRKGTVLQYATNDRFNGSAGGGGYRRGVLRANRCDDLILTNLTIRNTTPLNGSQAEAIIFNGSATTAHAIVSNVDLYSFQDTLQINGQAYISDSYIEGDVDFMWGTGPCFFENCICRSTRSRAYYTQIRNTSTHGYVYYKCTFDGMPGVTDNFLSRIEPVRFPNSEVVLIDCTMTESVGAVAWRLDGGATTAPNVHYWEYNSHTPDGKPVDMSKRFPLAKELKQPDDAQIIKDYSTPTFILGGDWNPRQVAIPKAP